MGAVISWFDKAFVYRVLRFDVVESESMSSIITTSDHPVEDGADITDHAQREAKTASITARVSQKPTRGQSLTKDGFVDGVYQPLTLKIPIAPATFLQGGVASSLGRVVTGPPSPVLTIPGALQFLFEQNRFEEVLKVLEQLQNDFQLVECQTLPWSVQNAIITNVTPQRDASTGGGGTVSIDFKTIRKARSKQGSGVTVPAEVKAKAKVNKGKQNPPPMVALPGGRSLLSSVFGR